MITTTNTELVELLPCPFCASSAQFHETYIDNDDWGWIDCDNCEASTAHGSRTGCAALWNTRAALNAGVEEG